MNFLGKLCCHRVIWLMVLFWALFRSLWNLGSLLLTCIDLKIPIFCSLSCKCNDISQSDLGTKGGFGDKGWPQALQQQRPGPADAPRQAVGEADCPLQQQARAAVSHGGPDEWACVDTWPNTYLSLAVEQRANWPVMSQPIWGPFFMTLTHEHGDLWCVNRMALKTATSYTNINYILTLEWPTHICLTQKGLWIRTNVTSLTPRVFPFTEYITCHVP